MATVTSTHTKPGFPAFGLAFVAVCLCACGASDAPTGAVSDLPPASLVAKGKSIAGKVTYLGEMPELPSNTANKAADPKCPHHEDIPDDRFVVGPHGGLAGVVLEVVDAPRTTDPEPITIDQQGCRYSPHISVGQSGVAVQVLNSDPTFHNVRVVRHKDGEYAGGRNISNDGQPPGAGPLSLALEEPGVYRLECDVHRWMRSFIYLSAGIFVCVTDDSGAFSFPRKLPDGVYRVKAWHPLAKRVLETECRVVDGVGNIDFAFHKDDLIF